MKDVLGFDMPIIRHSEEVRYIRRLLRLVGKFDITTEYRGLDLGCLEDLLDETFLVKKRGRSVA